MSDSINNIIYHLNQASTLHTLAQKSGVMPGIKALQTWQCQRLLASHKDLWQQKRFNPAMQFFIDELYGPKDFRQRDQDIAKVVPKMSKLLPEKALVSLESALHLNRLSFELDFDLARRLDGQPIDRNSYAQAYNACQNLEQRSQQIAFIEVLGQDLAEVVKIKGISALLMISRKPAKLAGLIELHEFLEKGYKAFKQLGSVADFIQPIVHKEKQIMQALFDQTQTNPLPEEV